MKINFILLFIVFISNDLRAQVDTIINYNTGKERVLLYDGDSRIFDQGIVDSSLCHKEIVYSTNINGLFFFKGNYLNGKKYSNGYGISEYLFRNILFLKVKRKIRNVVYDGKWFFYYQTGDIRMIGNYLLGERNGNWEYYDKQGVITRGEIYENGTLVKSW